MKRSAIYAALLFTMMMVVGIAEADTIRWDIISLTVQPTTIAAGGEASARTEGGLRITITGSGTFRVDNPNFGTSATGSVAAEGLITPDGFGEIGKTPTTDDFEISAKLSIGKVTGGGNWTLRDASGNTISSGTYRVVLLTRFDPAPGANTGINDQIGNLSDLHAGLAIMEIEYSDATRGILVISCHLAGTPDYIFEGIVISKANGFFWNREAVQGGVNANRTAFQS